MENKFQLKPGDRVSMDFAEEERKRVAGEGSVVHSKQLDSLGWFEDIYNMYGGSLLDWKKTGGLEDGYSTALDVKKFELLICTYVYASNIATFIVDLTKNGEVSGIGIGGLAYDNYGTSLGFFTGKVTVNAERTQLSVRIFNAFQGGYNDSYGYISRIVGVCRYEKNSN